LNDQIGFRLTLVGVINPHPNKQNYNLIRTFLDLLTISGTTWNFGAHIGSLESPRQMEKDGIFRIFLSAMFSTWRTIKPEVDDDSEQT
jgi:hypothetical protein